MIKFQKIYPERSRRAKIIFFAILFFGIFGLAKNSLAAAIYYVATNGNDNNTGTESQPWATFVRAQDTNKSTYLHPGDTLMIKDGTYYQSLNVTVSGTQTSPITIKAENDGQAVIDMQFNSSSGYSPLYINTKTDITIEGIKFQNSPNQVVWVKSSSRISLKKVTAYNTPYNLKSSVIQFYYSSDILLEDCAASGWGRNMFIMSEVQNAVIRRCWAAWKGWCQTPGVEGWCDNTVNGDNLCLQLYGSSNSIVENFICTKAPDASNVEWQGVNAWRNDWNTDASNNKYLGTVIVGDGSSLSNAVNNSSCYQRTHDNSFINMAIINAGNGYFQRGDDSATVDHNTIVTMADSGYAVSPTNDPCNGYPHAADYKLGFTLSNSSFLTNKQGFNIELDSDITTKIHKYNNFYNVNTPFNGISGDSTEYCDDGVGGCGSSAINPAYNTDTYGNGAYLMVPTALKGKGENGAYIGAEVLYRYQDGVLTNEHLWPWPMEQRICNETGYSVTYENGYSGCLNGDGIWKTLDGVYQTSDTTPPAAPSGLSV